MGPQVRVGAQILRRRGADALIPQERLKTGDVAWCLADAVAGLGDEGAVSLDLPPVFVPRRADLTGQMRPSGNQLAVFGGRPEHRQRRRGIVIVAVPSDGSPVRVGARDHAHDRKPAGQGARMCPDSFGDDAYRREWRCPVQELDELIAEIVVDCYDEDECMIAFCTVLGDEIPVPFETVFLGMPVKVIAIGAGRAPGVVGHLPARQGDRRGRPDLAEIAGRERGCRRPISATLGHDPDPVSPPPGWRLRSWEQP